MLTPAQVNDISFERLENNTYSAEAVDKAFEEIANDYGEIFAENGSMVRKLGVLAAKLEEYRKDETVLRDVLYNAQKSADMIIASAKEQAEEIIGKAETEVDAKKPKKPSTTSFQTATSKPRPSSRAPREGRTSCLRTPTPQRIPLW